MSYKDAYVVAYLTRESGLTGGTAGSRVPGMVDRLRTRFCEGTDIIPDQMS